MKPEKLKTVTIVDVAREAGVSHSTVSRVLNNKGYIKDETREHVLQVASNLGYVANQQARSLAGASSKLIGLIITTFSGSFTGILANHVDEELYKAGYSVAIFPSHDGFEREKMLIERTTTGLVDGLIIMMMGLPESYFELLDSRNIPYVLIGSEPGESQVKQSIIGQTSWQGAYDATQHLISLGHRRIAIIRGPDERVSSNDRVAGYRAALLDAGLEFEDELVVPGEYERSVSYEATKKLLSLPSPPTAIFATNDHSAIGAMDASREANITIPDELSIVGFDDIPAANIVIPRLTTVHVPLELMGREAVRILTERIENPSMPVRSVTLATRLVVRESTAPPPA